MCVCVCERERGWGGGMCFSLAVPHARQHLYVKALFLPLVPPPDAGPSINMVQIAAPTSV